MDELHLLEDSRLSRLSRSCALLEADEVTGVAILTEEQHFDLVALHHLVALELVLNLLVPLLALLLLCAHSATHDGGRGLCPG